MLVVLVLVVLTLVVLVLVLVQTRSNPTRFKKFGWASQSELLR